MKQQKSRNLFIELVVFDVAGTTIEDSGQVPAAFTHVLNAHGFTMTPEELRSARGASKREVIRSLVENEISGDAALIIDRADQIFTEFRECLAEIYRTGGVRAIPGTTDTFEWLRRKGVKIALNTGFDRMLTDLILQLAPWEKDCIQVVVCAEDVVAGRPAPDMIFRAMELAGINDAMSVAYVGDTVLDLQAGRNAGVRWNIGVLSGAHSKAQLEKVPHTHLLASVALLPSLW